jgi:adenylosuccinate lyase
VIARYSTDKMGAIWSRLKRFQTWLRVEVAVLRARSHLGHIPVQVPDNLEQTIMIDPDEIDRIEQDQTDHDVIAFLFHTSPQLPEDLRPLWHDKLTSYDPGDTGLHLQIRESVLVISESLGKLMMAIKNRALEHKYTAMPGHTHGVHAEPITFGVKMANWYDECIRQHERLGVILDSVGVAKISGVVGMYALPPEVEEHVCQQLGLKPIIATQIIGRDLIASYLSALANLGGTLAKIGIAIRLMQTTERREAQEYFAKSFRGSSALPHKRNPRRSENITGLARLLRAYAQVAFANQETWDERSIDNSGPERIILPDASHLADYMLGRMTRVVGKLEVFPARMLINLDLTKGLIYSQEVQALVAEKSGLPREEAYKIVSDVAQRCWDSGEDFFQELITDAAVINYVTRTELETCFELDRKLRYVDYIFGRVFGRSRCEELR